jgi:hypothetical protein
MTVRDLSVALCEAEKGKVEVNIAQMSEILARLADIALERPAEFAAAWARLLSRASGRQSAG